MFNPQPFQQGLQSALSIGGPAASGGAGGGIGGLLGGAGGGAGGGMSIPVGTQGLFGIGTNILGNIIGGPMVGRGFTDLENQIRQSLASQQAALGQSTGFLDPFRQTGQTAAQEELAALQGERDPAGFVSGILGRFQQSPAQRAAIQQGLEAVQNRLGAQGLGQSGAEQKALEQFAQQQTAGQQEQFLKDVLGVQQQRLGGLGQLGGFGLGAAGEESRAALQEAANEAALRLSLGQSQLARHKQEAAGTSNILGGIGSALDILGSPLGGSGQPGSSSGGGIGLGDIGGIASAIAAFL